MERPTMKESLNGYSLEKVHKLYAKCPELYKHIVKLDIYIDDLEDRLNNLAIADVVGRSEQLCPKCGSRNTEDIVCGDIGCNDCGNIWA
jgi:hypothetical protein